MLTSEVIERKLPTLNSKRFPESTCETLLQLLLRSCSTNHVVDQVSLDQIASRDSVFGEWLATIPSGMGIAEALVRESGWRESKPASEQLWDTANIAQRLQALEQRFEHELATQKREAIYHFAYGLSHELNNPLANIATRAGVLAHRESHVDRQQMLEMIIDNAMRGSEMLGDLMLLARPPKLNPQPVNLPIWFDALVARSNEWAAKRDLGIVAKCDLQTGSANFDSIAMTEATWCLVRNAFEASRKNESVQVHLGQAAEYLQLTVCDSGPGLSAQALRNCFDPYFSGREAGRGLGLGLSKAQLIATLHGGELKIGNRAEGGCEAVLKIPQGPTIQTPFNR